MMRRPLLARLLLGAVGAAVLALVFVGYLRPSFILDLANRIYLCF
ncbi:MAG: hypothetical protein WA924_13140 [Burkholderiaceae bacterium]